MPDEKKDNQPDTETPSKKEEPRQFWEWIKKPFGRKTGTEGETNIRNAAFSELTEEVQNTRTKDYIKNRLLPQMDWYSGKSRECRQKYQNCMTLSIVLGALIPVASVLANGGWFMKVLIALLGAAVTGINAYLSVKNYRELWVSYRTTRETLLSTLYCYFNNARVFEQKLTPEQKDVLLVNLCEDILNSENGGWRDTMRNAPAATLNFNPPPQSNP